MEHLTDVEGHGDEVVLVADRCGDSRGVTACGHDGVASGQGGLGDVDAHSAAGDKLQLNLAAGEVAVRTGTGDSGSYLFANKKSITFQEIEDGGTSQNLPTLSIDDQVLFEGTGGVKLVTFTVKLSSALFAPVGVDVAAVGNTAIYGSDFTATATRLAFAAGETSKTFTAVVFGDTEVESDESFFVNLTNATNATVLKGLGFGAIINDDTLVA